MAATSGLDDYQLSIRRLSERIVAALMSHRTEADRKLWVDRLQDATLQEEFGPEAGRGRRLAVWMAGVGVLLSLGGILADHALLLAGHGAPADWMTRGLAPTVALLVFFVGLYRFLVRARGYSRAEAVAACLGGKVLGEVDEKRFWQELPRLREQCGDRAVLRAIHYFEENARTLAQRAALAAGDFAAFARLAEKSGHSSFEYCQNVYCASSPKHQGLSAALAISQSILAGTGGAWRMQGGGVAGTIQAFVPDALVKRYCAAMEALFGPGCCYLLSLREQGAVRVM